MVVLQKNYIMQRQSMSRGYLFWLKEDKSFNKFSNVSLLLYFNLIEILRYLRLLNNPFFIFLYVILSEVIFLKTNLILIYKKHYLYSVGKFCF